MRNFKQKGLSPSEIWQLGGWYLSGIWQLRILFGTKRASSRVIKCLVCPVNLKNSIIFVPIEVDNYDYTGRNIAVPAL